jgi:hypothetical protein
MILGFRMRRLLEAFFILILTVFVLSCPLGVDLDKLPHKGNGVPSSFPRKALLEMVTTVEQSCVAADEVARALAGGGDTGSGGPGVDVYVLAFHRGDDLALNISKSSELSEFQSAYLDDVVASVSPHPAASVNRRPVEEGCFGLFLDCSRWEAEVDAAASTGEPAGTAAFGIRLLTVLEGATACAEAIVGFGEKPAADLRLTVFLSENGVERFLKGYGPYACDWVVRGLMRGPDYRHHPFGYALPTATMEAGDCVEATFSISLEDPEIEFEDLQSLCVTAVLHEPWYYSSENVFLPGRVINVEQTVLGGATDWE